jgi:hypothetical protein
MKIKIDIEKNILENSYRKDIEFCNIIVGIYQGDGDLDNNVMLIYHYINDENRIIWK